MIALTLPARSDANARFVTRLRDSGDLEDAEAILVSRQGNRKLYSGKAGLFELTLLDEDVDGDVVLVDPNRGLAERLIRASSDHNTLMVTERCDQLCVMCSQPPKNTHVDRWDEFLEAVLVAPFGKLIGISGGEPTLYKRELFDFLDAALAARPDLTFHILTNAQHFEDNDGARLRNPAYARIAWGIPIYSADPQLHDAIVAKPGAHERLRSSIAVLLGAGAHIELRTVVLSSNVQELPFLAEYVAGHLGFVDQWSIMQLESIGFAKNRFSELAITPERDFAHIADAIDIAELFGVGVALFNFPLCTVPLAYQRYTVRSISDWKRKYAPACQTCTAIARCGGFFAWHPENAMTVRPM